MRRSSPAPLRSLTATLGLLVLLQGLACRSPSVPPPQTVKKGYTERGLASWYGPGFDGRRTANGEVYDMHAMTAAHKTLPFGTVVEVRNRDNGRTARVRINDRGPFVKGRIIDLSKKGAKKIDMIGTGTARVEIRVVATSSSAPRYAAASSGEVRYVVQAGAFRDPDMARSLKRELERGFSGVEIRSDGLWHRVQLGPFDKRKKADKLAAELTGEGYDAVVKVKG
ncbi:MAG: septal ring lytic transglycosylase RlpA family protein [Thermoanaerobaculia bacterium]